MKYFDKKNSRLIQVDQAASPVFWDEKWEKENVGVYNSQSVAPIISITERYLPSSSLILEGGCGAGGKVAALTDAGFRVVGVDYAEKTVVRLNQRLPEYDVRTGDVFSLDFSDGFFDGYWSFGVIEHFWSGYLGIFHEANRVLREGGYLFLTFPCMSPVRNLKARLGSYRGWKDGEKEPDGFYQFMLDPFVVAKDLEGSGFSVIESQVMQLASGVKQEFPLVWRAFSVLSRVVGRDNILGGRLVENLFAGYMGHIAVVVAKRTSKFLK